jgi:hypothetical protein
MVINSTNINKTNDHLSNIVQTLTKDEGANIRSTKHTYKTKDQVTRTPLKTGDEFRYSGRVSS